jgi:hypothetical protein
MLTLVALLLAAADPATPVDNTPQPYLPKGAAGSTGGDSPEEIAADSARDLRDSRYYNKPGATRADYDKDWQECRLIARGSVTPNGAPTVIVYNPAVISPGAAAAGGLLGGLIAGAIQQGEQRRANRRSCLLVRGWRVVEVDEATQARIAAMSDLERSEAFNKAVGDPDPKGWIVTFTNSFAAPELAPEVLK